MKKELNVKARLMIGIIALFATGILTSNLLVEYQKDWIILIAMIIFSTVFLKCFTCEEIERPIYDKLSKIINAISIILVMIVLTLLPDSLGEMVSKNFQGILYFVSFLCWFLGIYLQGIKAKYKSNVS